MTADVSPLRYAAIGTADLERALSLYRGALAMELVAEEELAPAAAAALYGEPGLGAVRRLMLAQPGTELGMLQLLVFMGVPASPPCPSRPDDHGLIKTLDVFVADYDTAVTRLRERGFCFARPPRSYDGGSGLQAIEGHIEAPDGVTLAILHLVGVDRRQFAEADGLFSEVGASSQVVDDLAANVRFLREGLGFAVHYDEQLSGEAIDDLIGLPRGAGLRLRIMAREPTLVFVDAIADVTSTSVQPFSDDGFTAGRMPGLTRKIVRGSEDGARGFFLRIPPGWNQQLTEWHDCAEAALHLEGDLWHVRANNGAGGTMRRVCYFWRPRHILHGPMGSETGALTRVYVDGPLVNHFVEEGEEPPDTESAPPG